MRVVHFHPLLRRLDFFFTLALKRLRAFFIQGEEMLHALALGGEAGALKQ